MTLEEFEKATRLLRFTFENTLSMDANYIDELFKDNKLEDVKEEMKKLGVLVFRKERMTILYHGTITYMAKILLTKFGMTLFLNF